MVQPHHRREIVRLQSRRVFHCDIGIGISGIAHYQNFYIAAGNFIQCPALDGEYGTIRFQQIFTLHAFAAWTRTHEHRDTRVTESGFGIVVAVTPASSGNAQSSNSITTPLSEGNDGVYRATAE